MDEEKAAYEGQEQPEGEATEYGADELEAKPEWHDNPLYQAPGEGEFKVDEHGNPIYPDPQGAPTSSSSNTWPAGEEEQPEGEDEEKLQWHDNPLYEPADEQKEQPEEEGEQGEKY